MKATGGLESKRPKIDIIPRSKRDYDRVQNKTSVVFCPWYPSDAVVTHPDRRAGVFAVNEELYRLQREKNRKGEHRYPGLKMVVDSDQPIAYLVSENLADTKMIAKKLHAIYKSASRNNDHRSKPRRRVETPRLVTSKKRIGLRTNGGGILKSFV